MDKAAPIDQLGMLLRVFKNDITPEVLGMVRDRLKPTPEKLALLIVRMLNPDEIINKGEEAILRGVRPETLKGHKDRGELPELVNGNYPVNLR